jgi:hypothetical protein
VSEIVRRFAQANVTNNRSRIDRKTLATIWRTIHRHSHSILCRDDSVIVRSICAQNLSCWLPKITRPSHVNSHAVLGGVNALRFASTVRSARPAGVDPSSAPLESCTCAMVEV